ncbi:hypothetical protein ACOMHN_014742 [Nucella lapillus]
MENIMMDEKRKYVKLVDFGLSITFTKDELMKTHCGSPEYAAPEMCPGNDRYGPEIDVWSLGIVMYAMMMGHLPFTTPYTDHYRRLKLVQQMERGLGDSHSQEMAILSQDGQDMLRKVVEPSPELRIPLLDMEVHPWITSRGKVPFFPFQSFPRDKTMRTQTILELSEKLGVKKEHMEQKVGETKSDEMSAMYNMILDTKRREQGLFDVDHTAKQMERREPKPKRRAKSAPADKKGRVKGKAGAVPPALVLNNPEVCVESAPHSGSDATTGEPENRMTSFDFLALCSTPSWLGPERRRSRRRGRSPMAASAASSQHKNTEGMSVRSQIRRDYMERHGIEATHTVAGRGDDHHHHPHHHASPHTQHNHISVHGHHSPHPSSSSHLLSPEHAASNLSVPDVDGAHPRLHRGSSLKLSRKRARSFGPGQRRRSSFKRSGSVDTPVQSGPEGDSNPIQCSKSETLANSPSTLSMAAASLAVAFGGQTPKVLTLQVPALRANPAPRPANLTLKECYSLNLGGPKLNPPPSSSSKKSRSLAPPVCKGAEGGVGRGALTTLTSVEVHVSDTASPNLPIPNMVVVESSPSEVLGAVAGAECSKAPVGAQKMDLPSTSRLAPSWSTESLEDAEVEEHALPSPPEAGQAVGAAAGPSRLSRPFHHLLDRTQRPLFHHQVPAHAPLSTAQRPRLQEGGEKGATAMQLGVSKSHLRYYGSPPIRRPPDSRDLTHTVRGPRKMVEEMRGGFSSARLESDLRALTLDEMVGATGISGNFHDEDYDDDGDGLENEVEVMTEDEDVVFMSDSEHHAHEYARPLLRNRALGGLMSEVQQHGLPSPDEVEEDLLLLGTGSASGTATAAALAAALRSKRGSTGSYSQASSSGGGGKSQMRGSVPLQGGKLKTPTTPLSWMVLRSPLARIESFHSDDFEYYNSSDNEPAAEHASVASASSMSAGTPTVPCFAYRLNMPRKKPPKLKKGTAGDNTAGKTGKKSSAAAGEKMKGSAAPCIPDPAATDLLLSSGSDTELWDDFGDKSAMISKARVHPEDKESERQLLKAENKSALSNNVITQQPCRQSQQNSVNKVSKHAPPSLAVVDSKKKSATKNSPWKRSFAQFLKRKRQSPRCNNNNNDCVTSPMLPANHNGCSPTSPVTKVESNNLQTSIAPRAPATVVVVANNTSAADLAGEITSETGNCKPRVFAPATENNIAELVAGDPPPSSPVPPASPEAGVGARVFDFTLLNDESPKARACLLAWRPCGECAAASDLSSDDENECSPDPVVTLDLRPLGKSSMQGTILLGPSSLPSTTLTCTQT